MDQIIARWPVVIRTPDAEYTIKVDHASLPPGALLTWHVLPGQHYNGRGILCIGAEFVPVPRCPCRECVYARVGMAP